MRDFVNDAKLDRLLEQLRDHGWIGMRPGRSLELTEAGNKGHAEALRIQTELRNRTVRGITPEEYSTVIRV